MLLSHILIQTDLGFYRASVIDITDPSYYQQFTHLVNQSSTIYSADSDESYNFTLSDYGFGSTSATDPLSQFRTWSTVPEVEFDLTFNTSAPMLLNGGLGSFPFAGSTTYEWSMPAGQTTGSLTVNGETVSIDTSSSLTWYDRQWPSGSTTSGVAASAAVNWTWFELHLETGNQETPDVTMSVWTTEDSASGNKQFATVREAPGLHEVQMVSCVVSSNRTYVSNSTGAVYPLDWTLDFVDGTKLSISSIRPDQELHTDDGQNPTYEGVVTVQGSYKGSPKVTGYGVVEILPQTS